MSIFSYLNSNNSSSSAALYGRSYTSPLQQLLATNESASSGVVTTTASTTGSAVSISVAAAIASATEADAGKNASELATDIRADLDQQYEAEEGARADMSEMSARALSTVILNGDGGFSRAEVAAAKAELKSRDRAALQDVIAAGFSLSSLQTYQSQQISNRSAMSSEELSVRNLS